MQCKSLRSNVELHQIVLPTPQNKQNFFSCWKEQCLNYKICTRHIFPEHTSEEGKVKNEISVKTILASSLSHKIIFSYFRIFFYQKRKEKARLMKVFIAKTRLFPIIYCKLYIVTRRFSIKIQHFLKETIQFGRFRYLTFFQQ